MKKEKKDQIIRRISEQSILKLTPMPIGTADIYSAPCMILITEFQLIHNLVHDPISVMPTAFFIHI